MIDVTTLQGALAAAAISGAIKPKDEKEAKALLAEASSHPVDLTVRLVGIVTKGQGTPGCEVPASVDLITSAVVSELLVRLKADPIKVRRLLRSIGHGPDATTREENQRYLAEFNRVAGELAATMPKVKKAGREGAVRAELSLLEVITTNRGKEKQAA